MITTKYNINKLEHMSEILKAVAHPLRIAIIDILLQTQDLTVNNIQVALSISQPEASRQLKILKTAGLVSYHKKGNSRSYFLIDKDISRLLNCIENCSV